jgi:hypothetical protein
MGGRRTFRLGALVAAALLLTGSSPDCDDKECPFEAQIAEATVLSADTPSVTLTVPIDDPEETLTVWVARTTDGTSGELSIHGCSQDAEPSPADCPLVDVITLPSGVTEGSVSFAVDDISDYLLLWDGTDSIEVDASLSGMFMMEYNCAVGCGRKSSSSEPECDGGTTGYLSDRAPEFVE